MRINHIHIENIRSHKETTLALERITTVVGLNHSGKSSIEHCLELAFARRSASTGAGGQGQTDLLRFGEDMGAVELDLDLEGTPVELRASLTKRSGLNITLRNPVDKGWDPVPLAADMKADQDVLSCLIDNRFFVDMQPKDQKSLLASIILPATYDWPESIKTDLHNSRITANWQATPFEIIESCYDAAFTARTNVNRSIKDWREPTAATKYDGPPIDQIRTQLGIRQNERTAVAVEKQRLAGVITQAEQARANHERRASEAQMRIGTEKAEREKIAGGSLSKAAVKKLTEEAAGAARVAELESAILTRRTEIEAYDKQIKAVSALEGTPKCPTCFQTITEDVIEALGAPLIAARDSLWSQNYADQKAWKELGDPAGAQKKLDAHNTVEADLARIDKRISDLERTVKSATAEAENIKPEQLPKPETLDEKIADLDRRIGVGMGYLEAANRADALKADSETAQKRKAALDEKLASLERLVRYFGPKGVKAELIAEHIGGFEARINAVLERWGYAAALSLDPYGFIVSRTGSRYSCQLHMLSRSEKLRFANAFSVALAIVSGWGFAVLDDSETIVGDDRKRFNTLVYDSELEQCLILAAEVMEKVPVIPGTAFIALDETIEDGISTSNARVLASTPRG